MNSNLRSIAIRRLNILSGANTVGEADHVVERAMFACELAELGFRVKNISYVNSNVLANFEKDIKVLEALRGGDVSYVPLFTGFPNDVPNKSLFLVKRMMGYTANWLGLLGDSDGVTLEDGMIIPEWLFDLDQFGGDPILGRQDPELFRKGLEDQESRDSDSHVEWIDLKITSDQDSEAQLKTWMLNCFYSKSSIKESLKSDLESLIIHFGVDDVDADKITFRETKTYLSSSLWILKRYAEATSCLSTPTDVLRLMASLTDSDVSLSEKIKFPKLGRPQRRSVLSVLEASKNPAEDMNRYRDLWLAFGKGIHPGEYKSQYPKAADAFDTLRNKKIRSFESEVQAAIKACDVEQAVSLLKERPAVFGRKLHHLLELGTSGNSSVTAIGILLSSLVINPEEKWPHVLDVFETVAHKVPIKNLITLQAYFRTIESLDYRTTINKKGKLRVYANKKGRITTECNDRLNIILSSAIDRAMQDKESWSGKKVYIDPAIRGYVVPLSERKAADGLMTLARGTRIKIDATKVVRLFIHWKEAMQRTDLDLSAICYDNNMKFMGQVSYTNLSQGSIIHSGDFTSAPHGAAEFIDINIKEIKEQMEDVRYISTQTYVYSGENFAKLSECYAGWMIRDMASKKQSSFDVKTVQTKFDINGGGRYVIPCLLDLKTNEIIYVDLYRSGTPRGYGYNSVETSVGEVGAVTREVARMYHTRPNMHELALANAIGRGAKITDSRDDADITFGESDSTYNATDVELILSELI